MFTYYYYVFEMTQRDIEIRIDPRTVARRANGNIDGENEIRFSASRARNVIRSKSVEGSSVTTPLIARMIRLVFCGF